MLHHPPQHTYTSLPPPTTPSDPLKISTNWHAKCYSLHQNLQSAPRHDWACTWRSEFGLAQKRPFSAYARRLPLYHHPGTPSPLPTISGLIDTPNQPRLPFRPSNPCNTQNNPLPCLSPSKSDKVPPSPGPTYTLTSDHRMRQTRNLPSSRLAQNYCPQIRAAFILLHSFQWDVPWLRQGVALLHMILSSMGALRIVACNPCAPAFCGWARQTIA